MARHETASSKPDPTTVASIENPTQAEDQDQTGGGWAGATGGGSSAQVFEVTDLLIPSGTNLHGALHEIGTLTLDPSTSPWVSLYLECDAEPADSLYFGCADDANLAAAGPVLSTVLGPGGGLLWSTNGSSVDWTDADQTAPPYTDHTFHVGLWTDGPTTADITVVRARAAFLVI